MEILETLAQCFRLRVQPNQLADDSGQELVSVLQLEVRLYSFCDILGTVNIEMTLLIILAKQHRQNQLIMLE